MAATANGHQAATVNGHHFPVEVKLAPVAPLPKEIELDKLKAIVPQALAPESEEARSAALSQNGRREPSVYYARRLVQGASLPVTEPEADAEGASDKEAYMAGVLAKFRMHLEERTKHHLGELVVSYAVVAAFLPFLPLMLRVVGRTLIMMLSFFTSSLFRSIF